MWELYSYHEAFLLFDKDNLKFLATKTSHVDGRTNIV